MGTVAAGTTAGDAKRAALISIILSWFAPLLAEIVTTLAGAAGPAEGTATATEGVEELLAAFVGDIVAVADATGTGDNTGNLDDGDAAAEDAGAVRAADGSPGESPGGGAHVSSRTPPAAGAGAAVSIATLLLFPPAPLGLVLVPLGLVVLGLALVLGLVRVARLDGSEPAAGAEATEVPTPSAEEFDSCSTLSASGRTTPTGSTDAAWLRARSAAGDFSDDGAKASAAWMVSTSKSVVELISITLSRSAGPNRSTVDLIAPSDTDMVCTAVAMELRRGAERVSVSTREYTTWCVEDVAEEEEEEEEGRQVRSTAEGAAVKPPLGDRSPPHVEYSPVLCVCGDRSLHTPPLSPDATAGGGGGARLGGSTGEVSQMPRYGGLGYWEAWLTSRQYMLPNVDSA